MALIEEAELVNEHLGHHAPFDGPGFAALNTAFVSDGAFVHIPKGVRLQTPIHLLYLSTAKTKTDCQFFHAPSSSSKTELRDSSQKPLPVCSSAVPI